MAKPKKIPTTTIKKINPSKYIELNPTINSKPHMSEGMRHTAVVSIGDFSPPSNADGRLVESVEKYARVIKGDPLIFVSSQSMSEGYIEDQSRYQLARKAFGESMQSDMVADIMEAVKSLNGRYKNLVVIAPSAVAESYDHSITNFNNRDYQFESVEVISYSDPADQSDIIDYVIEDDFTSFKANLAYKLRPMAEEIFKESMKAMLAEGYLEERIHPLTYAQRIQKAQTMRRFARRIEMARERAQQRRATPEKLKQRSHKRALEIIRAKILKDKSYSDLSPMEKTTLDKRLMAIPQATIDRIARKMIPVVRKAENERMARRGKHKYTSTNEQFEAFVDDISESLNDVLDIIESVESSNLARTRASIKQEKNQDALKHHRMTTSAKRADLNKAAAEKFSELNKRITKNESTDVIKKIADKELERKRLLAAVKDYSKIKGLETLSKKERVEKAKQLADKSGLVIYNFNDIIDTHDKTSNASRRNKNFNAFDASESVDVANNEPIDREWGTDSLTAIYKNETPGQ